MKLTRMLAALLALGCASSVPVATAPSRSSILALLTPGDPDLDGRRVKPYSAQFRITGKRIPGDTAESVIARFRQSVSQPASGVLLAHFDYGAERVSIDSIWMDARSLRPRREWLRVGPTTMQFEYSPTEVQVASTRGDSTRRVTRAFTEETFAFNQLESIVQAIPLKAGYQRIVPLFSEMDAKVEHDTITVLARSASDGRWTVQFADPVIVQTYTVDEETHAVHSLSTLVRRQGMTMTRRAP
ncbi:MAG: hypothetical protein JWO05_3641 [Gemmatimonadetes bacterium]|nr:hypothetical protein [Gemmatimonadota bacterium]